MEQRKYIKYGISILLGTLVAEFLLFFLLINIRDKEMKNIKKYERDLGNFKEEIDKKRQEIKNFEDFKEKKAN